MLWLLVRGDLRDHQLRSVHTSVAIPLNFRLCDGQMTTSPPRIRCSDRLTLTRNSHTGRHSFFTLETNDDQTIAWSRIGKDLNLTNHIPIGHAHSAIN